MSTNSPADIISPDIHHEFLYVQVFCSIQLDTILKQQHED